MLFCEKSLMFGTTSIRFPVVTIQVVKKPKESWNEYFERLQDWIRKAKLSATDDWYLAHFRAHIRFGDDPFKNQMVNPQKWVDVMDNLEALYDRVKMERDIPKEVEDNDERKIDVVTRKHNQDFERRAKRMRNHKYMADGTPICDKCHKPGHIARKCPSARREGAKKFNQKQFSGSIVYAIDERASTPMVIHVTINGTEINAMLDSGSMENVIDIKVVRGIAPRVRLQEFRKRLIGADRKPIVVRGSA